jgi:hypothetical protein
MPGEKHHQSMHLVSLTVSVGEHCSPHDRTLKKR